jgi:hypothetical protein
MNEEFYVLLLLVLSLCDVVTETSAQGDMIESVRAGGMGIGTMVMLIVILIAVAFCLAMYFAEETSWGCICGIIVVLIVFTILMLCPRGSVYEEVPLENEYTFDEVSFFFSYCALAFRRAFSNLVTSLHDPQVQNGTALVRITLLIFVALCSAVAFWIYCYFGLLDELKPGEEDYGGFSSSKQGVYAKNC